MSANGRCGHRVPARKSEENRGPVNSKQIKESVDAKSLSHVNCTMCPNAGRQEVFTNEIWQFCKAAENGEGRFVTGKQSDRCNKKCPPQLTFIIT